jgi:hypothetical protein
MGNGRIRCFRSSTPSLTRHFACRPSPFLVRCSDLQEEFCTSERWKPIPQNLYSYAPVLSLTTTRIDLTCAQGIDPLFFYGFCTVGCVGMWLFEKETSLRVINKQQVLAL